MRYPDFSDAVSPPRLNRYLAACNGDKGKAMILYRWNINLSQEFSGILCMFEVVLRNAINKHYINTLGDSDWLNTEANKVVPLLNKKMIEKINIEKLATNYTHDRLVASLSFGTWTALFTKNHYKVLRKTLLEIFPNKTRGIDRTTIYNELDRIREFRNRIARHEPICFHRDGSISTILAKEIYDLIEKYIQFLGYIPIDLLWGITSPLVVINKINRMSI